MSTIKSLPARTGAILAAFALATATLAGALLPVTNAAAADVEVIDQGHLDVFRTVASSPNKIELKLEKPDQSLTDAENVAIYVKDRAYTNGTKNVPGIGKPTYSLLQTQEDYEIPWPGWSNMGVEAHGFNRVDFVMDSVSGPGDLYIYQQRGISQVKFTPMVEAKKASGDLSLRTGDVLVDSPPSHTHFYWSFTEKGVYRITAHAKAYNQAGHTVESAPHTVTYYVGVDPSQAAATETSESSGAGENSDNSGSASESNGTGENAAPSEGENSDNSGTTAGDDKGNPKGNGQADPNKQQPKDPANHQSQPKTGKNAEGNAGSGAANAATALTGGESAGMPAVGMGRTTTIGPAPAAPAGEKCLPTKVEHRLSAAEARKQGLSSGAGDGQALGLVPLIKDDRPSPARWVSPASLTFGISQAGFTKLPQEVRSHFGMPESGYLIGATQVHGIPWVGANTQNPSVEQQVEGGTTPEGKSWGGITWRLESVQGPGKLAVFQSGNFGKVIGKIWFSKPGDTVQMPLNTHVHPNWVFSKAGTYRVTISQTAKLRNGQRVSGSAVLTFIAGGAGNANDGHFDFGAEISKANAGSVAGKQVRKNPDGSYTVTEVVGRTPSGKPCSLDGLARTGASTFLLPLLVLAGGLTLAGAGSVALRSQLRH